MTDASDDWGRLLQAANAGDGRAYAAFLQRIAPVLRGVIRAKSGGLGDAACEDVLQEVLLAVHLKRHTLHEGAPVRPWLYAIARYKVVDAFRVRGRRIDLPIEDFADVLPAAPTVDPTDAADMEKMIGFLDARSARLVRMIGLEGSSMAEAATTLNMTEGALRVALHRALKQLAQLRERHIQ
jgi:RNA polymerase sigma-70 factor (ECF subfamily)